MLTLLHRKSLQAAFQLRQASSIHALMEQLSVADQKQAKTLLARYLADRKQLTMSQALQLFIELLQYNLNLYFNTFCTASSPWAQEDEFWECLDELEPLGNLLQTNKPYYRQRLVDGWIHNLAPERPAEKLFQVLQINESRTQLLYLLRADSLYAWYLMLLKASQSEPDDLFLLKCCKYILNSTDSSLSQHVREDVVNFIVHYFNGLTLHYPFRRTLDLTQLSYAEHSFDAFCKVIIPALRLG